MTRPHMPGRIKLAVLFLNMAQNGGVLLCDEFKRPITFSEICDGEIHFDHTPPLKLRFFNKETQKYEPHANDPDFIKVTSVEGHSFRTNKKRGLYHGDQTQIAHNRRLQENCADHNAAMLAKARGEKIERKKKGRKVKSRGFQTNKDGKWKKPLHGPAVRRNT